MFHICSFLRLLGRIALIVYFLVAALILGLRYGVLPHIDHWRPQIEQQLSLSLGSQVSLQKVSAEWNGLNPSLQLEGLSFTDRRQRQVLRLPQVRAVFSWRSLLNGSVQLKTLEASGLHLNVRLDKKRHLWVLGRPFDLDQAAGSDELGLDHPVMQWLVQQRQILLRDASINWRDENRSGAPLKLQQVQLSFLSQNDQHSVSLSAIPPKELGQSLEMRGQFNLADTQLRRADPQAWDGQLYVQVAGLVMRGWIPWLDIPSNLDSGEVSAQWWLGIRRGELDRFTYDIAIRDGHWTPDAESSIKTQTARVFLTGPWNAFLQLASIGVPSTNGSAPPLPSQPGVLPVPLVSAAPPVPAVQFQVSVGSFSANAKQVFTQPLDFDRVFLAGSLSRLENHALQAVFDQAHLVNNDMDARLQGRWHQGGTGPAGMLEMTGLFSRASVKAISRYLPITVNEDAREWMAKGLVGGQIQQGRVMVKGDLEHFPFGQQPEAGDFTFDGHYTDAIIDYIPPEGKSLGWPRLSQMSGTLSLHRADLRLDVDKAMMWPTDKAAISLHGVKARIPNLEYKSVLSIEGRTTAQASTYLALSAHSPLGKILDGALDEAQAQGQWEVPLQLTIPLLNSLDTTVRGAVQFGGGSFQLMPEIPVFQKVNGVLNFSDVGLDTSNLKAQFLGGPVTLSGGVGGQQKGVLMRGRTNARALTEFVGLQGMKRLDGQLAYSVLVRRDKNRRTVLTVDSDLVGLALDFPAPLGKPAAQAMPLHALWSPAKKAAETALDISLGSTLKVSLLHRVGGKPYFYSGGVGVNQSPALLPLGMNVDIRYPAIDVDAWNRIVDEFGKPIAAGQPGRAYPLLPELQYLRLQSERTRMFGLTLDQSTLTAKQFEPLRWRMDISSSQTAGTLFWREASGRIAGRVDARFDRLAVGQAADTEQTAKEAPAEQPQPGQDGLHIDDYVDIPAVNLEVNKFMLYGRTIGRLSVEGLNEARGQLWRLNKLSLTSPAAQLHGSGSWRLSGPDRGLTLDAHADVTDLGAYLGQLGFKDIMQQGKGTLAGRFDWRNLPWDFKRSDLNGELKVQFEGGRFSSVNSRSARLLELLSLQSIQRLATLNFKPGDLFKGGFGFDSLRGTLHIKEGVVSTNDYSISGPVGVISIGGDVNLVSEKLNLQAMVVPNLDISGATIAAGIAINPVVGLGAFLTQWLLRAPLSKAMTVHYQVSGNWDDPKLNEVAAPSSLEKGAAK